MSILFGEVVDQYKCKEERELACEEANEGYTSFVFSPYLICHDYTETGYRAHSTAQVLRLGRQKTERWKIDCCEMKEGRARDSSSFAFSQNPLLLLVVNSSILTLSMVTDQ